MQEEIGKLVPLISLTHEMQLSDPFSEIHEAKCHADSKQAPIVGILLCYLKV